MRLFWCPKTRAVRALWMLEELGEPYERVLVDIRDPSAPKDPGFAKASPMGKVPALEDGDVGVAESAALCLYVSDRYAPGRLAPALDAAERGRFLYWMMYTPAVIEPAMVEKMNKLEPNRLSHGWGSYDAMIETLTRGLEPGPWILGGQFSAADVMLGGSVSFLRQFNMLGDAPVLEAYADRCEARPAFQTSREIDDAG